MKFRYPENWLIVKLSNSISIYFLLMIWILFGCFGTLDYTTAWGCMYSEVPIFATENIIFSGIAIGLISYGFFSKKKTLGIILLISELIIWLFKLFIIKGGYAIGFGGMPSSTVLGYDIIALTLRLILIKKLITNTNKKYLF